MISYDHAAPKPNTYYCTECRKADREHAVIERHAGYVPANTRGLGNPGEPMTEYVCTCCGVTRGPFIPASI